MRLLDERGATRAIGVADPENELVRVWSHGDDARAPDAPFVRARLAAALDLRRTLGLADGESAYRLFNAEGDGMSGLAVDVYGTFARRDGAVAWAARARAPARAVSAGAACPPPGCRSRARS